MKTSTTIRAGSTGKTGGWPIWPLSITVFLILFVLSLVGFLIFAGTHDVELVTDNYYEKTLQYQAQIDRINRTKALAEPVLLRYEAGEKVYRVTFPAEFKSGDIQGRLSFYRPNDAGADVSFPLQLNAVREQVFSTAALSSGLWRVKITWDSDGVEYYNEGSFVIDY
ncbi:MAG: FixH family protein [Lentisphaeria bacterium]|nr:FixH family protein [Candidatus Neomarinimicrobiota bacterium]MCF7842753.1 FixH family protein [Lentisphaeria bacterium]